MKLRTPLAAMIAANSGLAMAADFGSGSGGHSKATATAKTTTARRQRSVGSAGVASALGLAMTTGLLRQKSAVFAPADGRDTHAPGTWKNENVNVDSDSEEAIAGLSDDVEHAAGEARNC